MTREESMLRQVAANGSPDLTFEELICVSDELPSEVVRQIAGSADRAAALDCWQGLMHAAVDSIAERYKGSCLDDLDDEELAVVAKARGWQEIGEATSKASEEIDRAELRLMHVAKEYAGGLSEGLHTLARIYARKIELLDAMIKAAD